MNKVILVLTVLLGMISLGKAQNSKTFYDSVIKNEDQEQKAPILLPYVDPADVVWSRTIVRELVLREKMNLPLYYPTQPIDGRMSLIDLMLKGIEKSFKTAYEDDELQVPLSFEDIKSKFGAKSDTIVRRTETGEKENVIIAGEMHTDEVKRLLIKELWYLNRRTSRLDVRIIALCPVREYTKDDGGYDGILKSRLFWIDYGEFRDLFVKQKVFNYGNDAVRLSMDDIFLKRFFSSRIIQESNVYDNRTISSYSVGMDAVLESDRIKNEIFNIEQDLWQY